LRIADCGLRIEKQEIGKRLFELRIADCGMEKCIPDERCQLVDLMWRQSRESTIDHRWQRISGDLNPQSEIHNPQLKGGLDPDSCIMYKLYIIPLPC
jgi:hypothetical protein